MARILVPILSLLLLTACAGVGATSPTTPSPEATASNEPLELKVMTYNVLGGMPPARWFPLIDIAELDPMVRLPATVELMEHIDADVIGLQEYRPNRESGVRMVADLDGYTWVSPDASAGREAVAIPILYRTDRFEAVASGNKKVTTARENGAWIDRFVNWVELRDLRSGRQFFIFNYHGHHRQTETLAAVRSAAISSMIELVESVNPGFAQPFAIVGDFNSGSKETRPGFYDHFLKLGERGIVDAATIAEEDASDVPEAASLHKMSAKVDGKDVAKVVRRNGVHIDYVWVPEDAEVRSWATVSGPNVEWRKVRGERVPVWTGIIPSDHSPVVADIRFLAP